jgi:hypothetical protein
LNEENFGKIEQISKYFEGLGFSCKREVRTLFSKHNESLDVFDNHLNKIDLCCRKNINLQNPNQENSNTIGAGEIYCFEVEGTQFSQCLKNLRGMQQASEVWKQKGYDVNLCQLGSHEDFKKVCENVPLADNHDIPNKETKPKVIITKNIQQFRIPKTRLGFW